MKIKTLAKVKIVFWCLFPLLFLWAPGIAWTIAALVIAKWFLKWLFSPIVFKIEKSRK